MSPSPSPSLSPSPEEEKRGGEFSTLSDVDSDRLAAAAHAAKIPNKTETLVRYLEAWVAQTSEDEVVRVLRLQTSKGKDVLSIHDAHFKGGKPKSGVEAWAASQKAKGLM